MLKSPNFQDYWLCERSRGSWEKGLPSLGLGWVSHVIVMRSPKTLNPNTHTCTCKWGAHHQTWALLLRTIMISCAKNGYLYRELYFRRLMKSTHSRKNLWPSICYCKLLPTSNLLVKLVRHAFSCIIQMLLTMPTVASTDYRPQVPAHSQSRLLTRLRFASSDGSITK